MIIFFVVQIDSVGTYHVMGREVVTSKSNVTSITSLGRIRTAPSSKYSKLSL